MQNTPNTCIYHQEMPEDMHTQFNMMGCWTGPLLLTVFMTGEFMYILNILSFYLCHQIKSLDFFFL